MVFICTGAVLSVWLRQPYGIYDNDHDVPNDADDDDDDGINGVKDNDDDYDEGSDEHDVKYFMTLGSLNLFNVVKNLA